MLLKYLNSYAKTEKIKFDAKRKNDQEFLNRLNSAVLDALNMFKWSGLPDTVDARMLELSAIMNGVSLIAWDSEKHSYYSLIASPDGSMTLYGYPAGAYGYGLNGYVKHFSLYVEGGENVPILNGGDKGTANAVLLKDNLLMYPLINYLTLYAERIADANRSIDVIARCLKSPAIIKTDPAGVESVKKVLSDINMNIPYIVGINDTPYSSMEAISTGITPDSLSALYEYSQDLQSGLANLLGINSNPDTTKRERMLVDEVNANNMQTSYNIMTRLEMRKEFCKEVNELFGLSIDVEINKSLAARYNKEKEGNEDNDRDNIKA